MADAAFSVFGALSGCIGCMVCVESLAKEAPFAMNLLTFSTFLFISIEGLIFTTQFFTIKNKISLKGYLPVVLSFFACNVINNQALNFHVPVPLHIIFRSGSLLTSLLMNRILLGRKYSINKYISVIAITIGICLCTLATSRIEKKSDSLLSPKQAEKHYREWLIGVFMLTTALLISSFLAICQERMYKIYGKYPREAMFYIHAVSLPFFVFMGNDITESAIKFSLSPKPELFGFIFPIPILWLKLLLVAFLQWFCIMFVYKLNASIDSLSVTLVVTLRKFLSLLISIFWFNNLFTITHWLGALLVFGGTLIFADVPNKIFLIISRREKDEKEEPIFICSN
ncbi:hypothetical protein Mgra_00002404 [Meloidogyne graminicola]|uniref:UDP-xylose and UDP-N-acetylglucosamine transporter n=1 Tax=Meloidogyne graminicola TaxID=189291 RepID=A0A8S9ZX32_9BILA|nr:hypothetical protein Mgra_00002404 [Meloidogyne graminicola]